MVSVERLKFLAVFQAADPNSVAESPNGLGRLHSLMRQGCALGINPVPLALSSGHRINARRLRLMKELMGLSRRLLCHRLSTL
jgi:hypothetical protein